MGGLNGGSRALSIKRIRWYCVPPCLLYHRCRSCPLHTHAQSLEDEAVRAQALRLVSLPLWHALSRGRLQLELHDQPQVCGGLSGIGGAARQAERWAEGWLSLVCWGQLSRCKMLRAVRLCPSPDCAAGQALEAPGQEGGQGGGGGGGFPHPCAAAPRGDLPARHAHCRCIAPLLYAHQHIAFCRKKLLLPTF